jgi:hypothetical protein
MTSVCLPAQFAAFTGNSELIEFCRNRFKEVIVPEQIAADGSFPLELTRTKPYGYCLFNLDVMSTVCQLLSTPGDKSFRLFTARRQRIRKSDGFHASVHREQKLLALRT